MLLDFCGKDFIQIPTSLQFLTRIASHPRKNVHVKAAFLLTTKLLDLGRQSLRASQRLKVTSSTGDEKEAVSSKI